MSLTAIREGRIKAANQTPVLGQLDQWEASNDPDLVSLLWLSNQWRLMKVIYQDYQLPCHHYNQDQCSVKSSQFQILNIFQDTENVTLLIQSDNRDKKYEKWTHIQINGFGATRCCACLISNECWISMLWLEFIRQSGLRKTESW